MAGLSEVSFLSSISVSLCKICSMEINKKIAITFLTITLGLTTVFSGNQVSASIIPNSNSAKQILKQGCLQQGGMLSDYADFLEEVDNDDESDDEQEYSLAAERSDRPELLNKYSF